ncbi:MAG: DUF2029 domain-containing protein [Bdellovibrionales bacterium]|nr:DUF2029 domain-containing protein [Bdellovibrionales bacterium]
MKRTRLIQTGLLLGILALLAAISVRSHGQYCLPIFAGAGSDSWSGLNPYLIREGRPDFFKYAPIWAILLAPLHFILEFSSQSVAEWFWCFFNFLCFVGASVLYLTSFSESSHSRFRWIVLGVLLIPLMLNNGFYGQINSLLWLLISVSWVGSRSLKPAFAVIAGFCLSLTIWMKIFPILFTVFLLLPDRRLSAEIRRSWFFGLIGGFALGVGLPLLVWRGETFAVFSSWFDVLARDIHAPHLKIGLASILPSHWLRFFPVIQVFYFGGVIFWAWASQKGVSSVEVCLKTC